MGLPLDSLDDVLLEISSIRRLLPVRPTPEQYHSALSAIAKADNHLSARLDELAKLSRPDSLPPPAFRALQEMREDLLRMQVREQQRPWLMLVHLEERHQFYDQLLLKAGSGTAGGIGSVNGNVNGTVDGNVSGHDVLGGIESSSSGELSEQAVQSSGQKFYSANTPPPPPTSLASLSLETPHARSLTSLSTTRSSLEAPEEAPKALTTINENPQEPHCPPELQALFQAAADSRSESLIIVDTFFRGRILLPDPVMSRLTNLRVLEISGNRIFRLPESLGDLSHLTELDVQSNQLTALPESLGRLTELKKLNVEKNAIEELPWTIGNCESLEELRADFNQLKALPEAVGYLGKLQVLTVHLNCMKSLPTTMAYLTSLRELDVHFNQLESVPESLSFVSTLRKLNLSSNFHALRSLPFKFGSLQQLEELDISYNSILELPDSFVLLTSLRKLRMDGNPWRVPPLQVTEKGKEAVFEYMHERIRQKQQEKLAKKKRSFVVKAAHACCSYFGSLCESKHGDSGLNILA